MLPKVLSYPRCERSVIIDFANEDVYTALMIDPHNPQSHFIQCRLALLGHDEPSFSSHVSQLAGEKQFYYLTIIADELSRMSDRSNLLQHLLESIQSMPQSIESEEQGLRLLVCQRCLYKMKMQQKR